VPTSRELNRPNPVSKARLTPQEAASTIASQVLTFSAQATQGIGELLLPKEPALKRVFSSQIRNAERFEVLKLNCDMVIAHVGVTEYTLERGDYWNRDNSDIVSLVRQLSFQAITQAFERSGRTTIDTNHFVREKTERFGIYSATTHAENIAEEIMKDHELPSTMGVTELVEFLGPSRISTYKELWAKDQEQTLQLQRPSIADLLSEVYQHWRGRAPSRDMDAIQFNILLEGSLFGLALLIMKFCDDIEIT
jgi:hypothetical protein